MSGLGSLFGIGDSSTSTGGGGGSFFSPQNIMGALVVGTQILGSLNEQDNAAAERDWRKQQADESQRRWQAEFDFSKEKYLESLKRGSGGGGGGGGSGAGPLAIQKSNLIKNAYDNMIQYSMAGRAEEAKQLGVLLNALQRPLLSGGMGGQ